jgi:hypothetical protein
MANRTLDNPKIRNFARVGDHKRNFIRLGDACSECLRHLACTNKSDLSHSKLSFAKWTRQRAGLKSTSRASKVLTFNDQNFPQKMKAAKEVCLPAGVVGQRFYGAACS